MARILAAALAALVLAGCASQPPGTASAGNPVTGRSHTTGITAHRAASRTPHAVTGTGRVSRTRLRNIASAHPRTENINCAGVATARRVVRVSPSPATSHVRICLAVGTTLVIRLRGVHAYHWTRPRLIGDRHILRRIGAGGGRTHASYIAVAPGTVRTIAVGSPPNGTMGAVFQWFAWVVVR